MCLMAVAIYPWFVGCGGENFGIVVMAQWTCVPHPVRLCLDGDILGVVVIFAMELGLHAAAACSVAVERLVARQVRIVESMGNRRDY